MIACDTQVVRWPSLFFFFNDTATTEIYTLSLHDALPISLSAAPAARLSRSHQQLRPRQLRGRRRPGRRVRPRRRLLPGEPVRSEEHTSELQSRQYLVCRLLLEKKTQHNCSTHV